MIIVFHKTFKKKYKKAPSKIRRQFDERLLLFEKNLFNPLLNNHPLTGKRSGEWSINITGDWRAVYVFDEKKGAVIFIDIGTHPDLYE